MTHAETYRPDGQAKDSRDRAEAHLPRARFFARIADIARRHPRYSAAILTAGLGMLHAMGTDHKADAPPAGATERHLAHMPMLMGNVAVDDLVQAPTVAPPIATATAGATAGATASATGEPSPRPSPDPSEPTPETPPPATPTELPPPTETREAKIQLSGEAVVSVNGPRDPYAPSDMLANTAVTGGLIPTGEGTGWIMGQNGPVAYRFTAGDNNFVEVDMATLRAEGILDRLPDTDHQYIDERSIVIDLLKRSGNERAITQTSSQEGGARRLAGDVTRIPHVRYKMAEPFQFVDNAVHAPAGVPVRFYLRYSFGSNSRIVIGSGIRFNAPGATINLQFINGRPQVYSTSPDKGPDNVWIVDGNYVLPAQTDGFMEVALTLNAARTQAEIDILNGEGAVVTSYTARLVYPIPADRPLQVLVQSDSEGLEGDVAPLVEAADVSFPAQPDLLAATLDASDTSPSAEDARAAEALNRQDYTPLSKVYSRVYMVQGGGNVDDGLHAAIPGWTRFARYNGLGMYTDRALFLSFNNGDTTRWASDYYWMTRSGLFPHARNRSIREFKAESGLPQRVFADMRVLPPGGQYQVSSPLPPDAKPDEVLAYLRALYAGPNRFEVAMYGLIDDTTGNPGKGLALVDPDPARAMRDIAGALPADAALIPAFMRTSGLTDRNISRIMGTLDEVRQAKPGFIPAVSVSTLSSTDLPTHLRYVEALRAALGQRGMALDITDVGCRSGFSFEQAADFARGDRPELDGALFLCQNSVPALDQPGSLPLLRHDATNNQMTPTQEFFALTKP